MKRLAVLIPYRNREQHLRVLVPRLVEVLTSDGRIADVRSTVVILEQADDALFNRGALLNAGFLLMEQQIDYVCLHDVDYVPIDADYSMPSLPTRRIWEGAELRPREPGSGTMITHRADLFFSAVVLFTNEHFRKINGYSNGYRGWGYEDDDLRQRCVLCGLTPQLDGGKFQALDHVNRGFKPDMTFTEDGMRNQERFRRRWMDQVSASKFKSDGLNTLRFDYAIRDDYVRELFAPDICNHIRHYRLRNFRYDPSCEP